LIRCAVDECYGACDFGEQYACHGAYELQAPAHESITFNEFLFSITGDPLVGVTVRACVRQDLDCAQPVAEAVTDNLGGIVLDLPVTGVGWNGYWTYDGGGVYPAIRYGSLPIVRDLLRAGFFPLQVGDWDSIALEAGLEDRPDRGHLMLIAKDCLDVPSSGVSFEIEGGGDPDATQYYFVDGLPVLEATETRGGPDLYNGLGGWINVVPGTMLVRSRVAATGEEIDSQTVVVRAGRLTYVNLSP
jgi:hypothetical protein